MSKTIKVQKGEGPWQVARRAGISLSGVTALVGGTKAAYDSNRRLKRLQAEDALSILARISAFEPSIPITRKVKH